MLKSVEISLKNKYPVPNDPLLLSMRELYQTIDIYGTGNLDLKIGCLMEYMERDLTWPLKIDPILENLALDRIVLDLSYSYHSDSCKCNMAAISIMSFDSGFALRAPKAVEIQGWDAGGEDAEAMVHACLGDWTMKRMMGYSDPARYTKSKAEEWLLEKGALD